MLAADIKAATSRKCSRSLKKKHDPEGRTKMMKSMLKGVIDSMAPPFTIQRMDKLVDLRSEVIQRSISS